MRAKTQRGSKAEEAFDASALDAVDENGMFNYNKWSARTPPRSTASPTTRRPSAEPGPGSGRSASFDRIGAGFALPTAGCANCRTIEGDAGDETRDWGPPFHEEDYGLRSRRAGCGTISAKMQYASQLQTTE